MPAIPGTRPRRPAAAENGFRRRPVKHAKLRQLLFWALCCDLGLFAKRLIAPVGNLITDALHIPGGVGTSFSLMFLVIGCCTVPRFGSGALMGLVQSVLAVLFGMTGSMGILAPIGYVIPGLIVDIVLWAGRRGHLDKMVSCLLANMLSSAAAALTANIIVFRLRGLVLALYVAVSLFTGAVSGLAAGRAVRRLEVILKAHGGKEVSRETEKDSAYGHPDPGGSRGAAGDPVSYK